MWVVLKEVQLGTDRPEVSPKCEFGTAPILVVNDPNVRYQARPPGTQRREESGIVSGVKEVRRVVQGTTLEIIQKQPARLLEVSSQTGLSRARQAAEKNELSALSGHKLRLATVVHLVALTFLRVGGPAGGRVRLHPLVR